jgi:hypothetical protein
VCFLSLCLGYVAVTERGNVTCEMCVLYVLGCSVSLMIASRGVGDSPGVLGVVTFLGRLCILFGCVSALE